jgi:hypothetical protein
MCYQTSHILVFGKQTEYFVEIGAEIIMQKYLAFQRHYISLEMSHIVIVAVPFVRLRPLYQRQNYMAQSA